MIPTSTHVSITVKTKPPAQPEATAVFVAQGSESAPPAAALLGPEVSQSVTRLLSGKASSGKARECVFDLVGDGKKLRRVYLIGLGTVAKRTTETVRQSAGALGKALRKHKIGTVAIAIDGIDGISAAAFADAVVTGITLAAFDYREYKGTASKKKEDGEAEQKSLAVELICGEGSLAEVRAAAERALIICDAQNFARTIDSRPGNNIDPPALAAVARHLAEEAGISCRVMDEKELARLGMGGILAVGLGSISSPPRMIVLEYKPAGAPGNSRPLLLVGKAVTFDTGGISIKPADKMGKMIFDKCGGVAVLALMYAAAKLKIPIHIVGIVSSAENSISSKAYRPGDILRMYNGVTVEVTNTDAEGRLVLGDAMSWGVEKYAPSAVVDLATLTGGVIVALGRSIAGIMSNNDVLTQEIIAAGDAAGEKLWRLPVEEEHRDFIKSDCADIVNSAGREGHPLQGAAFLSNFVPADGSIPWAHLDIAGVADTERELPYYAKGATGWGVRTLVNWVTARSKAAPAAETKAPPAKSSSKASTTKKK